MSNTLFNNSLFSKNLFDNKLFSPETNPPVSVSFNLVDSKTGNAVVANNITFNGSSIAFTQVGKLITITVPSIGSFTIGITATNYIDFSSSYTATTLNGSSLNMTAVQQTEDMEVNITWSHSSSETSRDIDTYTYVFEGTTQKAKVYHGTKTYSDSNTSITLDKDDTGSKDGENVTIQPVYDGYNYHLYLLDYTGRSSTLPTHFADWAVTVRVTYGNQVIQNMTAPTDAKGRYWDVLTISNGNVTLINSFSDTEPS